MSISGERMLAEIGIPYQKIHELRRLNVSDELVSKWKTLYEIAKSIGLAESINSAIQQYRQFT